MPTDTPTKDYASITVSDNENGKVDMVASASDTLADESLLSKFAGMFLTEIQDGTVDAGIPFDAEREGEAMLVFEYDADGEVAMDFIANPTMTPGTGEVSPAQALALSALRRVEARIGVGSLELTGAQCEG